MKVAALIPARKGSKGIPGKNFKNFCGVPLWRWTLEAAKESLVFDLIVLSSDGGFTDIQPEDGIVYDNERLEELATDKADLDSLLRFYAEKNPDVDVWCLLQPTSPLREAGDISGAYDILSETTKSGEPKYDSVVSVFNHPVIGWIANTIYHKGRKYHTALYHTENRPNRQDRKDWFLENGAVYFVTIEGLMARGSRVGLMPGLYVMPKERSFEIDDETDWRICEMLMEGK